MSEVREAPRLRVHRGQAALKAIPRGHSAGQVVEHVLAQTTNVQPSLQREVRAQIRVLDTQSSRGHRPVSGPQPHTVSSGLQLPPLRVMWPTPNLLFHFAICLLLPGTPRCPGGKRKQLEEPAPVLSPTHLMCQFRPVIRAFHSCAAWSLPPRSLPLPESPILRTPPGLPASQLCSAGFKPGTLQQLGLDWGSVDTGKKSFRVHPLTSLSVKGPQSLGSPGWPGGRVSGRHDGSHLCWEPLYKLKTQARITPWLVAAL